MTDEERQELYKRICNDINCGTYLMAPEYVDKLLKKKNKKIKRIVKRTIFNLQKLEKILEG